jgi:hypothetical protein
MNVAEAKTIAKEWVESRKSEIPGFIGAMTGGSVNEMNDSDPWTSSSDYDIWIMVDDPKKVPMESWQKFVYRGLLLEVSLREYAGNSLPENVLSNGFESFHFTVPNIISDPTGQMEVVRREVRRQYGEKRWILKRLEAVHESADWKFHKLIAPSQDDKTIDLFYHYLSGFKNMNDLLPVAALRSPTLRRNFLLARGILAAHGRSDLLEKVYGAFGIRDFTKADVEGLLRNLPIALTRAKEVRATYFWMDHILKEEDPYSVVAEGVREMMDDGMHREALFSLFQYTYIAFRALLNDTSGPELQEWSERWDVLMLKLGIRERKDISIRAEAAMNILEEMMALSRDIAGV